MKRVLSLVLAFIILLSCLYGCTGENAEEQKSGEQLTYYIYKNSYYSLYDLIDKYNNYCKRNRKQENMIEITEFATEDEMYTKMSTEIMSGTGPDIFSLDRNIPYEKLFKSNIFADVNKICEQDSSKNKIDFSKYNSAIMDAGVIDGKRYVVPLFYGVNTMTGNKELLEKYNLPDKQGYSLTYKNIERDFKNFFEKRDDEYFTEYSEDVSYYGSNYDALLKNLIDDYIDYENKTVMFDSDEFRNALDMLEKIRKCSGPLWEEITWNSAHYNTMLFSSGLDDMISIARNQTGNEVIMKGFTKDESEIPAYVQIGVAFNQNSKKYDKILDFLKYCLSEDTQERMCGIKGNDLGSSSHPVLNSAFEKSIVKAADTENIMEEVMGVDTEFMQAYIKICRSINSCSLFNNSQPYRGSYYFNSVAGEIIEDYKSGELSKDKFIRNLTSATQIYLYE